LGEHGVGGELGELRGPQADSEDSVLRDPVGIDVGEGLARGDTRLALERTDEDSVRGEQVVDGGTLGKELCLSAAGGEEQCISSPGLERMSKVHPGFELASRIVRIALTRQQQKRESGCARLTRRFGMAQSTSRRRSWTWWRPRRFVA
jgi:hypothetical protein